MPTPRLMLFAIMALGMACAGCEQKQPAQTTSQAAPETHQSIKASSGDLTLNVTLNVDRLDLTVADRLELLLTATAPSDAALTLPSSSQAFDGLTVISREERREQIDAAQTRTTLTLALEPFLGGPKTIPALSFTASRGSQKAVAKTEPISFTVASVASKDADAQTPLNPTPGFVSLPIASSIEDRSQLWIIVGISAGVIALATTGYFVVSRRRNRIASPHARARAELDAIARSLDGTPVSPASDVAVRLSATLRTFINDHLGVGSPGDSAADFARLAPSAGNLTPGDQDTLARLLRDLEHTCFAPGAATDGVARSLFERTSRWIDEVHAYTEVRR